MNEPGFPQIEDPYGLLIDPQAMEVVKAMFAACRRVVIHKELGGGFSGSHVYWVTPVRMDETSEIPAVVKMGPVSAMREEWRAYQEHIRDRLPGISDIHGDLVSLPMNPWGGLRYVLAGWGVFEVESFYHFFPQADTGTILDLWENQLFRVLKSLWGFHHSVGEFSLQASYEFLLPVNWIIQPVTLQPGTSSHLLRAEIRAKPTLKAGDYVSLEGFEVVEVDPSQQALLLNVPFHSSGQRDSFRIRLQPVEAIESYSVGFLIDHLDGMVIQTRADLLQSQIQRAIGTSWNLTAGVLRLPAGIRLPNPLTVLPRLPGFFRHVRMARIHGDLNLENILVAHQGSHLGVFLIDFATARQDHVLHDFLRLETEIVTRVIPAACVEAGLDVDHLAPVIRDFYLEAHKSTVQIRRIAPVLPYPAFEKPFAMLMLLRKTARDHLVDTQDWSEYYQGLVIYLLGALKLKSLDQPPAAPWAKPAAFWAAAVVYDFLEPVAEKSAPTSIDWEQARRYLPDAIYRAKDLDSGLNALNRILRDVITYLPRPLVLDLLQLPVFTEQGRFLEGTLLFTNLAGFTAFAEKLKAQDRYAGPEILVRLLNQYLDQMLGILFRYQGVLVKFDGETMLCLFAETSQVQTALNAVCAAYEMKQTWQKNLEGTVRISQEIMPLGMKAGSHSGQLFLARVGNTEHMEYILTGLAAMRVAQTEASAGQGEILLSPETYHLIKEYIEAQAIYDGSGFYCLQKLLTFSPPRTDGWNDIEKRLASLADDLGALAERLNVLTPYLPTGILPYLIHSSSEIEGQYRQVTILFINFIGMSKIMHAHGEDEARIVADLSQYIRAVHEEVQYYGGVIYKASLCEQGDQFMVVFGAPTAHEKDTRRAALTALALQRKIKRLPSPTARLLSQRMGIHTGIVFAGKIGSQSHHQCEYTVIGEDVNLAKWLMTHALPGQIWVSAQVRERIQEDCEFEALPSGQDGGCEWAPIYRLQKTHAVSAAQHPPRRLHSEPVGRAVELAQLISRFDDLTTGAGKQIMAIAGEAGVGKTRLIGEWQRACEKSGHTFTRLTGNGHAYGQIPYGIFVEIFEQVFGFTPNDSPEACWNKLAEQVEAFSDQSEAGWSNEFEDQLAYLGQFLALDLSFQKGLIERVNPLSAEALYLQMRLSLCAFLTGLARKQPLMLILEDLHWADDQSLELLVFLLNQLSDDLPILFCLTYRTQKERTIWKTWQEIERTHPDCLAIQLKELDAADGRRLLSNLLHNEQLPEYFQTLIFKQTDGNPLYIEEVLLALIRQGVLARGIKEDWEIIRNIEQIEMPDQLQQIIQSRVDELDFGSPGARRVLWMAAVIGDEFSRDTLQDLYVEVNGNRSMRELEDHLRLLRNAAMIQTVNPRETGQLGAYRFRHGLVRQVAYENILVYKRREYHCAVARSLENRHGQDLPRCYHALAGHYDQGQQWGKAFEYHLLAGQRDAQSYANTEAYDHLCRAIEIAPLATPGPEDLAQAYFIAGKISSALGKFDTAQAFLERADQMWANVVGVTAPFRRARVCYEMGRIYEQRGGRENWDRAFVWKEKGLTHLLDCPPSAESAWLHILAGIVATRQKNLPLAILEGEQALAHAQACASQPEMAAAYRMLSVAWRYQQRPDRAMEYCQKAIAIDMACADLPAQAKDYANLGVIAWDMGDWPMAKEASLKAVKVGESMASQYPLAMNYCNLADTCRGLGELDTALSYARRGLQIFEKINSSQGIIFAHAVLGPILWRRGDFESASNCLLAARRLIVVHQAPEFATSVGRWLAQVYLSQGRLEQAEAEVQALLADPAELDGEAEAVQRLWGQILAARGQWHEAAQVLLISLERLEAEGERYEIAITLLAYASVLTQIKGSAEARTAAEQARAIFISLGAQVDLRDVETFIGGLEN